MPTSLISLKDKLTRAHVGTTLSMAQAGGASAYKTKAAVDGLRLAARKDMLRDLYPLSARLLGHDWSSVASAYLSHHQGRPLQMYGLGRSFGQHLTTDGGKLTQRYPHLADLVDLEWTEVRVSVRKVADRRSPYKAPSTTEELNGLGPVANKALALRTYSYPMPAIVHRLKNGIGLPEKIRPATTHMCIYKNPDTSKCEVLELSGVVARLVTTAMEAPVSYTRLIEMTAPLARQSDTVEAIVAILELVDKLQNLQIFVGSLVVAEKTKAL